MQYVSQMFQTYTRAYPKRLQWMMDFHKTVWGLCIDHGQWESDIALSSATLHLRLKTELFKLSYRDSIGLLLRHDTSAITTDYNRCPVPAVSSAWPSRIKIAWFLDFLVRKNDQCLWTNRWIWTYWY